VSPRAGLDGCRKSRLHWDSIPGPKRIATPTEPCRPAMSRSMMPNYQCLGGKNHPYLQGRKVCHVENVRVARGLSLYPEVGSSMFHRKADVYILCIYIYTFIYIYLLIAIGLSPGGSTHLHTLHEINST
jgi:hypothetical protein